LLYARLIIDINYLRARLMSCSLLSNQCECSRASARSSSAASVALVRVRCALVTCQQPRRSSVVQTQKWSRRRRTDREDFRASHRHLRQGALRAKCCPRAASSNQTRCANSRPRLHWPNLKDRQTQESSLETLILILPSAVGAKSEITWFTKDILDASDCVLFTQKNTFLFSVSHTSFILNFDFYAFFPD
jgi:hypothetical protein